MSDIQDIDDPKHWQYKASDWEITAYDEAIDQLLRWVDEEEECPNFIDRIMGGIESCPTTSKLHFQGYIKTSQDRKSKFKPYFPTTRIRKAQNVFALKSYVMKMETSVGRKVDWRNPNFQKKINGHPRQKDEEDKLSNYELLKLMIKFKIENMGQINGDPKTHFRQIRSYWHDCEPDFVAQYAGRLVSQQFREMYQAFGDSIYKEMMYQKERQEYEETGVL